MTINRILLFVVFSLVTRETIAQAKPDDDRKLWLGTMDKIARPILSALAEDRLRETMPVVLSPHIDNREERSKVTYLEAWGRVLSGIAPWLDGEGGSKEEIALRLQYREWALKAVAHSVNPSAKDYMVWSGGQPLVDASFFALGLIRCPWLWAHLDPSVQQQVVTALKMTRSTVPVYSNWILFSAMIEAFFCKYGLDYDAVRIEYAVREFSQHWYLGDGTFSDGMTFHQDYYNSYVIQPYLSTVLVVVNAHNEMDRRYRMFSEKLDRITKRYAEIQERMINTDGSFPVTGRSITYRCGAFHHLADMAARRQLPSSLPPGQVRSALTAVIKKTLAAPGTFTAQGWLTIGLYGRQAELADSYITGGSLYLCSEVFLPLGLPATDPFWSSPPAPWTAVKVWSGMDSTGADHALDLSDAPPVRSSNVRPTPPTGHSSGALFATMKPGGTSPRTPDAPAVISSWRARKENKSNLLYEAGSQDWPGSAPRQSEQPGWLRSNPFRQPHYILVDLALGGDNGGDLTSTVFPKRLGHQGMNWQ